MTKPLSYFSCSLSKRGKEEFRRVTFQPFVPLLRGVPVPEQLCLSLHLLPSVPFPPLPVGLLSPCPTSLLPDSLACQHTSITLHCHCPRRTSLRYLLQWGPVSPPPVSCSPSSLATSIWLPLLSAGEISPSSGTLLLLPGRLFFRRKKKNAPHSYFHSIFWPFCSNGVVFNHGLFFLRKHIIGRSPAQFMPDFQGPCSRWSLKMPPTVPADPSARGLCCFSRASRGGICFSCPCVWWPFDLLWPTECVEVTLQAQPQLLDALQRPLLLLGPCPETAKTTGWRSCSSHQRMGGDTEETWRCEAPPSQHPALSAGRHLGPSSSGARQLIAVRCASPPVKQRNHPAKCTVRRAGRSLLFSATKSWSGLLCRHRTERGALQGGLMLSLVCVCVCACKPAYFNLWNWFLRDASVNRGETASSCPVLLLPPAHSPPPSLCAHTRHGCACCVRLCTVNIL